MRVKFCFLLSLSFVFIYPALSQNLLKGRVNNYTYDTLYPLPNATIKNITSGQSVVSDANGNYTIEANLSDQVIFSHTNYTSDTITVEDQFYISGYDAALIEKSLFMNRVTVTGSYSNDSLRRRQENASVFEKKPGITGGNTPEAGVGIVLSPASFFSKDAKEERRLKKRLIRQEEDKYIDFVFSPGRVTSLTGLKDEELQAFFIRYRPTYALARKLGYEGMTVYINDKFKEFKTPQETKEKKK
ncbi:MAG: hypothetical protein QM640_09935 [Niabella sp.]